MRNDEMKAVYAAIERCNWEEARKIVSACHILSVHLGRLEIPATRHIALEFDAFAIRAEICQLERHQQLYATFLTKDQVDQENK